MVEKEEKRRLEARITSMQSQLLIGGHKIEDMPVFRSALCQAGKQMDLSVKSVCKHVFCGM